jgi:uridine kinase
MDLDELYAHLIELKNGNSVERPSYCFKTHTRLAETVPFTSKKYLLLDGILSIHDQNIYELCDHSIYVDVDADLRFIRRLQRDMRERGRSVESIATQYLESVRSMFIRYVEPQRDRANHIVDWNDYNYECVQEIIKTLNVPL